MDLAIKILRNPDETTDAKDLAEVVLKQGLMPPILCLGPSGEITEIPKAMTTCEAAFS
jgi:hypothetical protein